GGHVNVLLERGDRTEARVLVARDVHRPREPVAGRAVVAEEREVARVALQRGLEERGDVDLREAALVLRGHEAAQVQDAVAARAEVVRAPDFVPLTMVGAIDVDGCLEREWG